RRAAPAAARPPPRRIVRARSGAGAQGDHVAPGSPVAGLPRRARPRARALVGAAPGPRATAQLGPPAAPGRKHAALHPVELAPVREGCHRLPTRADAQRRAPRPTLGRGLPDPGLRPRGPRLRLGAAQRRRLLWLLAGAGPRRARARRPARAAMARTGAAALDGRLPGAAFRARVFRALHDQHLARLPRRARPPRVLPAAAPSCRAGRPGPSAHGRGRRGGRRRIAYALPIARKYSSERRTLSRDGMVGRSWSTTYQRAPPDPLRGYSADAKMAGRSSVPSPTSAQLRSAAMSLR